MKTFKKLVGFLIIITLSASCATSDKVITGNYIQKRKYNKGLYVSAKAKKEKTNRKLKFQKLNQAMQKRIKLLQSHRLNLIMTTKKLIKLATILS